MKVTAVTFKKNSASYCHISVDGEYVFTAHVEVVARYGLSVGRELSQQQLAAAQREAELKKGKEKALELLSYRAHSRRELTQKLRRSVGEEAAVQAADRMEELGLVDDETFAERLASDLFERKLYSRNRVRYALRQKGISPSLADELAARCSDEEEQARIRRLLERKYPLADGAMKQKAAASLARQGFRYGDIRLVLEGYFGGEELD